MSKVTARRLLAICLATWAWSFSFGLGTQVITHWLNDALRGRDDVNGIIGYNHLAYYLGIGLASLAVPWLTTRLGSFCTPVGMFLSGLTLALFPFGGGLAGWFILRLFNGMSGALCLVPLETLISGNSSPRQRARNFSFYAVALTLGGAMGMWAGLGFYRPGDVSAFFVGGLFPVAAGLLLLRTLPTAIFETMPRAAPLPSYWGQPFFAYASAWFQGFLEGGMLAFLSLYLESIGVSAAGAGRLMGITMLGVLLFQVPAAWLADRLGHMAALLGCYVVVGIGLALLPVLAPSIALAVCLFFLGACSGALYPLALAFLGDQLDQARMARAYAWFLAMECVGSQLGAAAMGEARDRWGESSMFAVGLAALALVLASWATVSIWDRYRRFPRQAPRRRERYEQEARVS